MWIHSAVRAVILKWMFTLWTVSLPEVGVNSTAPVLSGGDSDLYGMTGASVVESMMCFMFSLVFNVGKSTEIAGVISAVSDSGCHISWWWCYLDQRSEQPHSDQHDRRSRGEWCWCTGDWFSYYALGDWQCDDKAAVGYFYEPEWITNNDLFLSSCSFFGEAQELTQTNKVFFFVRSNSLNGCSHPIHNPERFVLGTVRILNIGHRPFQPTYTFFQSQAASWGWPSCS